MAANEIRDVLRKGIRQTTPPTPTNLTYLQNAIWTDQSLAAKFGEPDERKNHISVGGVGPETEDWIWHRSGGTVRAKFARRGYGQELLEFAPNGRLLPKFRPELYSNDLHYVRGADPSGPAALKLQIIEVTVDPQDSTADDATTH